ncbi:MAG: ATP-binding protein [Armatimonadota bacterium]
MSERSEERILILTPVGDPDLGVGPLLRAGTALPVQDFQDLERLSASLDAGVAAVLLTGAWDRSPGAERFQAWVERQPAWSELPILVVVSGDDRTRSSRAWRRLGNVTLLEPPLRDSTLSTAVQAALRSRRRQYQIREHLREREAAAAALRESEERLRFSLEAGNLGFWQHDLQTDQLLCSERCKAHFGRPPHEPLSHEEILSIVHPDDRERARLTIGRAVSAGESYVLEYRVVWRDGSVHWLMVRGRASYDDAGQPVSTFGVTLDVTQRMEAERRQAQQAERLRLLSESAGRLLAAESRDDLVAELFSRVRESLGLDLYLYHAADADRGTLRLGSCAGVPEGVASRLREPSLGEGSSRGESGTRAPLTRAEVETAAVAWAGLLSEAGVRAFTCQPLLVGDRLLGTLAFGARDQSEFSDEQIAFLRTVCDYVAIAMERVRVEESLRESSRRKDEFVAMLAHELRNPLAPVTNALEIMRARPGRETGERARKVIDRQIRHMTRLIDDLLDISRVNTGKITLRRERLDLSEALRQAVEGVRGLVAQAGHTLEMTLPGQPVWVEVDPVRLEQLVSNLLSNSAKYTESGGRIEVTLSSEGSSARISVRDTGIGIGPELLPRVFDLFTQGERGLDRSQGGLGLGLALVSSIARLHGGEVEARSAGHGQGSEFVVTLPLAPAAAPESLPAPVTELPSRRRPPLAVPPACRLLVVDDNRDSAETLAELAQLWGFEIDTAYDGVSALHRASAWLPELILLDIGMPGLSGYEVARQLRQDARFSNATLIAVSGYGQSEDLERSRAAGFDHHVVKPVDPGKLERLLRDAAEQRTGRSGESSQLP